MTVVQNKYPPESSARAWADATGRHPRVAKQSGHRKNEKGAYSCLVPVPPQKSVRLRKPWQPPSKAQVSAKIAVVPNECQRVLIITEQVGCASGRVGPTLTAPTSSFFYVTQWYSSWARSGTYSAKSVNLCNLTSPVADWAITSYVS